MLCERCKIREANIQYTEIINGVKTDHNFCAQCAKEVDFGPYSAIFDGDFPLGKLLSGLLSGEESSKKPDKLQKITCPTCKTGYDEFVNNSCFGCADCYSVFDVLIHDNIKQLQGSDCHRGKRPTYLRSSLPADVAGGNMIHHDSMEDAMRTWNIRLREALKREEYETAAECRDKIKELKEGNQTNA